MLGTSVLNDSVEKFQHPERAMRVNVVSAGKSRKAARDGAALDNETGGPETVAALKLVAANQVLVGPKGRSATP